MTFKNLAPFLFVAVAGLGVGVFAALKAGENYLNQKPPAPASDLPANPTLKPLWNAPAFTLTDQEGRAMTDRDLRGHVWISDFIFTQCGGSCPVMTAKMANLQKAIEDPGVKFVSFSVDPDHDTPAGLKAYGVRYGADFLRWSFLSSPGRHAIWDVAKGMKIATGQADAQDQLLHSDRFLLTDGTGQVRGAYDSSDDGALKRLAADAATLSHERVP